MRTSIVGRFAALAAFGVACFVPTGCDNNAEIDRKGFTRAPDGLASQFRELDQSIAVVIMVSTRRHGQPPDEYVLTIGEAQSGDVQARLHPMPKTSAQGVILPALVGRTIAPNLAVKFQSVFREFAERVEVQADVSTGTGPDSSTYVVAVLARNRDVVVVWLDEAQRKRDSRAEVIIEIADNLRRALTSGPEMLSDSNMLKIESLLERVRTGYGMIRRDE
jgi:hypothetical protein